VLDEATASVDYETDSLIQVHPLWSQYSFNVLIVANHPTAIVEKDQRHNIHMHSAPS